MSVMNGIILRGKVLNLVMLSDTEKNDSCYRCALSMHECGSLCVRFGRMLGYNVGAIARMYFKE